LDETSILLLRESVLLAMEPLRTEASAALPKQAVVSFRPGLAAPAS